MPAARSATRTILLIDDDAEVRQACAQVLSEEGYSVHAASDGVSGIAQLDCMPDVIVLDLVMPRMDGWEFIRRLRAVAGHEHTPVLVLTATSSSGAALVGAQAILRKPFVVDALLRQVADLSP